MNTTSKTGGVFTFDHGQKKLNKAIGVTEEYMDDLQNHIADVLKDFLFDKNQNLREDMSPSILVEKCINEFSYSELILMSMFFLQHKIDDFTKQMESKLENMKMEVRKIALDIDEIPPHIREMILNLTKGDSKKNPISGNDIPQELKDYLDGLSEEND
jgi:hypothetical protein